MTVTKFDLIAVYHDRETTELTRRLAANIEHYEPAGQYAFIEVDNTVENRGFAKGCNYGAALGRAPFIGFLNPDLVVHGPFLDPVSSVFDRHDEVVITGSSFAKPRSHIERWGVRDWVCGAALFVRRSFFDSVGGFDEQFVWAWEETDLCRRAEALGLRVCAQDGQLPFEHHSQGNNTHYKRLHFANGARRYRDKWRLQLRPPPHPADPQGPPTASIVIATYGYREVWDRIADRAIASANAQTVPVEVIRHHGATLARARNEGAAMARTDWLCFLDADDELPPDYIEQSLRGKGDVRVPWVVRRIGKTRRGPRRLRPCNLLLRNYIVVGALTRKSLFERIGGFAEWPMLEDWELWIRAMKAGADIRECRGAVYHAHQRPGSRNDQSRELRNSTYLAIRRLHGSG